jgi:ethanolamine ammonia-lyase small subunit
MVGAALMRVPLVLPSPVPASQLRESTAARLALGRSGSSLPTRAHLDFVGDHARARDAVWTPVDFDALAASLASLGVASLRVRSRAGDRAVYLRRPDLGRGLDAESTERLLAVGGRPAPNVALVLADGLSAEAVQTHAAPLAAALLPRFAAAGLRVSPAVLVEQGRVGAGDEVGEALGADLVVLLVGERPGLSASDSLGCYLTWQARPGTPDSRRNCVSNIRAEGLGVDEAAARIAWLAVEASRLRRTGVDLRLDFEGVAALEGGRPPGPE